MIEFDDYKQKINGLVPVLDTIKQALKLDESAEELRLLEEESTQDEFWTNLENSQKVLQRIKQLRTKAQNYDKLAGGWNDLMALCQMAIEEND